MNKKVFISYSHQDDSTAKQLISSLRQQGIQVVQFDNVVASESKSVKTSINNSIQKAGDFIILLSQSSQASSWIAFETGAAMALGIKIIPVLLTENKEDIPIYLRHLQVRKLGPDLYKELRETNNTNN